jgi:hypothetical protein
MDKKNKIPLYTQVQEEIFMFIGDYSNVIKDLKNPNKL